MASGSNHGAARRCTLLALCVAGCASGNPFESAGPALGDEDSGGTHDDGMLPAVNTQDGGPGGADDGTTGPGVGSDGPTGASTDSATTGPCVPQTWARDDDDDGYGDPSMTQQACTPPPGHVADATDCDDGDPTVYPGANEACGGADKNCDFVAPALCNSCLQLQDGGNGDRNGLYTIDVDGPDEPLPPTQVWCDQQTDGGGWTLVQRTVWDPVQTTALRTTFATWHDQTIGNPNPGQGYRLQGAAWGHLNLQLDHLLRHEIRQTDGSACAPLFYMGSDGDLTVSDTAALLTGLTADVSMIGATELSATDTGPSPHCINDNLGVPWFFGQCCSTCPVYQGGYWTEPHPMASYVGSVPDLDGHTEADVCPGVPEMALSGDVFRGIQSMEYYLR